MLSRYALSAEMTAVNTVSILLLLLLASAMMQLSYARSATVRMNSREISEKVKAMIMSEVHLHSANQGTKSMHDGTIIQDKIGESIVTTTPDGVCHLMDSSEVSDCFTYLIDPRTPAATAKFSMSLKRNMEPINATVTLYEVSRWRANFTRLGRATLDWKEIGLIRNLRIEILRNAKSWFNSNVGSNKRLFHRVKVDVTVNSQPVSYFNLFVEPPELDFAYYDAPPQSECNPRVECCLILHYVNFTEIGWNKFIMYPEGFYANYCIGPLYSECAHDDPEVENILRHDSGMSTSPLLNIALDWTEMMELFIR
ncbi:hypothetical protein RB195_013232 [Necator americanus]|uniref:TGF-beta family profile domain-containing protein n=1 Tax=Necator americanus TaxID=51031 RepID=A0ABR1DUM2_NECAM